MCRRTKVDYTKQVPIPQGAPCCACYLWICDSNSPFHVVLVLRAASIPNYIEKRGWWQYTPPPRRCRSARRRAQWRWWLHNEISSPTHICNLSSLYSSIIYYWYLIVVLYRLVLSLLCSHSAIRSSSSFSSSSCSHIYMYVHKCRMDHQTCTHFDRRNFFHTTLFENHGNMRCKVW